jgi:hypothetical protein
MLVKDHQPRRRAASALVCTLPPGGDGQAPARTVDRGHGRIAQRPSTTREALVGDSTWPGLAQGWALGRHGSRQNTAAERVAVGDGVTSLRPERATPGRLWALVRGQWHMEQKLPGVRDGPGAEDPAQGRCGNLPQVLAALCNPVMGLLRCAGHTNSAAACRRLAAQPLQALALSGIALEN